MKNNFVPHFKLLIITLISSLLSQNLLAEINWAQVQQGNKIILIRHASAPGNGDPEGFKINDCKTQRNLGKKGIEQSIQIGKLFKKKAIPVDKILTSQWCRCKDTAKYAFKNYIEFSALNSTFQSPFDKNEERQIVQIKKYVKNWKAKKKNLVMITHYSVITAITNAVPASGEIIVTDRNFNVLETILVD